MKCIDYHQVELYCMRHCKTEVPITVLKDLANVDAEPVVHSHWGHNEELHASRCHHCGACYNGLLNENYCSHCGAKMVEEKCP